MLVAGRPSSVRNNVLCNVHMMHCGVTMAFSRRKKDLILFYAFIALASRIKCAQSEEEPWSFIVIADWHGAETFAKKPGTSSKAWQNSLSTIKHIKENYGGDLVMLPGDSNTGEWDTEKFINKLNPNLTPEEAVLQAGRNCYSTVKNLFNAGGYDQILMALGDHEIGGNAWQPGSSKMDNLNAYRQIFTEGFNTDPVSGDFLFSKPIGSIVSHPVGTPFASTSYAYQHKNVLFITVDAFQTVGSGNSPFLDKETGRGGEGAVTCTLDGEHLMWFQTILKEAQNNTSIQHTFVQAHVPIIQPVRKMACSGQFLDQGEDSKFWKLMREYEVDIYFAGEVHANTVSKDTVPESNLIQIAARGNSFNNFLKVLVTDDAIEITAYNEIGQKHRFNNNYESYGHLNINKWGSNFTSESSGALKFVDFHLPLIYLSFEEIVPLESRQVIGMVHNDFKNKLIGSNITIQGIHCTDAIPNEGSFGQLYDAQVGNLELVTGKVGSRAASFTTQSRLAFFATGPHNAGSVLSFSLWIKTSQQSSEMILVHHGSIYTSLKTSKDCFTLTLNEGIPNLYTSPKKRLAPTTLNVKINDGSWHHVAISMPKKSCLLSEVIMYIDSKRISTNVDKKDEHVFHVTSGRMSLGGFGYSSSQYESEIFPQTTPYIGLMDDFKLWSREIQIADLPTIKSERSIVIHKGRACTRDGTTAPSLQLSFMKCYRKCLLNEACLGFEWSKLEGKKECFNLDYSPGIGVRKKLTRCGLVEN